MRKMYYEELPKWESGKNKGGIRWDMCVGKIIKFIYDDTEGEIEIIDVYGSNLIIKYQDKDPFTVNKGSLINCNIGRLIGKYTNEFKFEISQILKDNKRNMVITDKEYRNRIRKDGKIEKEKWYKYTCNICSWTKGEIVESGLINGNGCACCNNKIVVEGINDIPTTAPWMVQFFKGGYEEAKKYCHQSNQKIKPICPDCGRVKDKEMCISVIHNNKSITCLCGDGISYPEKFMFNVLEKLELDFKTQLNKKQLLWCGKYKYDFYFDLNGESYIIETNGSQHPNTKYSCSGFKKLSGRTYEEELQNDITKKELALDNGINENSYIVIDCSLSDMDFIKNEILNSRLNEIFDLSAIDWFKCEEFALSNRVKEACELKKNNPDLSCKEIGNIMKSSTSVIIDYLKKGSKIWNWINYDPKEEMRKGGNKSSKSNCKKVEMFKDGISLGRFESATELARNGESLFNIKLVASSISAVCLGKNKHHKGFDFKYV